jgi:hypothetical protein
MATKTIDQLPSSSPLTGSEVLPIVQGNETVKTTVQEIGSFTRPYKVYTALLTQRGGNDPGSFFSAENGNLIIGVTYEINNYKSGDDFTNVGAPSNANGVQFVATGTTAAKWDGETELRFNSGAPIVTVLENTIGNIWVTYDKTGIYQINSNGLFTPNKTTFFINLMDEDVSTGNLCLGNIVDAYYCSIATGDLSSRHNNVLAKLTPIEIRVYN